jgi:hypothetical protein
MIHVNQEIQLLDVTTDGYIIYAKYTAVFNKGNYNDERKSQCVAPIWVRN